jgi:transcriptional antiterminator NusG
MAIFIYRVTAGQERVVMEMMSKRVKAETLGIYSIVHFEDLRGYMIVEAADALSARQAGLKIPHIKGVLDKPAALSELDSLLSAAKPVSAQVAKGDIVELISGPFKGERAKVIRIDENKDELTVELTEVAVPIPVTIKSNTIRLYQKAADANQ